MSLRLSFATLFCFVLIWACADAARHRSRRQVTSDQCLNPTGNMCTFVTCENNGQCLEDSTTSDCFKCQCLPGFTGRICDVPVVISPGCNPACQNGGNCIGNTCVCPSGYTGLFCETRDYCLPVNPCQHGGRCVTTAGNYVCDCTGTGFTGTNCAESVVTNPCTSSPCQNGGHCAWDGVTMSCACIGGFSGSVCQIAPVPCAAAPCENGGQCDLIAENTFGCVCPPEYTGARCETFVLSTHPCVTMPTTVCQNGGVCTVNGADYLCNCPPGWTGRNCETLTAASVCSPSPCGAHGSCVQAVVPSGAVAYCLCDADWTGRYCDVLVAVSNCFDGYCLSGGTCRMGAGGRYCECTPWYTGERCETQLGFETTTTTTTTTPMPSVLLCSPSPCQNGGICLTDNVTFVCACPPNWIGSTCSVYEAPIVTTTTVAPVISPCTPNPCRNGGTCYRNSVIFACACVAPWTGSTCESSQAITQPPIGITCANQPCRNGGVCYNTGDSYYCLCGINSIYTGRNCETVIPIAPSDCPLNCAPGYCVSSGSSANPYVCMCDGVMKLRTCV